MGQPRYAFALHQSDYSCVTVADLVQGHCHLMMDNLQEAYTSYQQALYHLRDPKVCRDILVRLIKANSPFEGA
jgi:hypothetical protein